MSALDEIWGEHARQGGFVLIAGHTPVGEIPRSMIGGAVLADLGEGTKGWVRWRGTMILLPTVVEVARPPHESYRIDQMMTMGTLDCDLDEHDYAERAKKRHDSYWRPVWWTGK